jgi:tetratricopeptide (TPR) repeat protein
VVSAWEERVARAIERYEDGAARLPDDPDERQRQLTRMGNAAWAAGLSLLMQGRREEAVAWLVRAAERYRESWPAAPPESWGRPIGAMKSRLIAGDPDGARADADWALDAGAAAANGPIGRYGAALAYLVCGEDGRALGLVETLRDREDFPRTVAATLAALSSSDRTGYETAVEGLLADFEARDEFLEDIPVADTVIAFQVLAEARGFATVLASPLLPACGSRPSSSRSKTAS